MPDYMRDCYDDQFHLKNNGWLTLVAPVYFEFRKDLMSVIRNAFDQGQRARLVKETMLHIIYGLR
jgi:hypothetical protein